MRPPGRRVSLMSFSNAELPSAAALGGLQLNISAIIGPALGGLVVAWIGPNPVFRSERRLLPGRDFGCPAMEESGRTTEDWPGELFRLFCDGYPLRPVCARTSNCFGAECVVCPVHFSHSRTDANRRPESIRSQPFTTRPFIHEHGGGLCCRRGVHYSATQRPILAEHAHHIG
jgi:Transmembrane secretion effector